MTPDNAIYYQAAYGIAGVVYGAYIVSLIVRARRVRDRQARLAKNDVAGSGWD